jgi:hypothetical protein
MRDALPGCGLLVRSCLVAGLKGVEGVGLEGLREVRTKELWTGRYGTGRRERKGSGPPADGGGADGSVADKGGVGRRCGTEGCGTGGCGTERYGTERYGTGCARKGANREARAGCGRCRRISVTGRTAGSERHRRRVWAVTGVCGALRRQRCGQRRLGLRTTGRADLGDQTEGPERKAPTAWFAWRVGRAWVGSGPYERVQLKQVDQRMLPDRTGYGGACCARLEG